MNLSDAIIPSDYSAVFIDIDNTLLDFDAYVRNTLEEGFGHFGICSYEPRMEEVFHRENNKLWRAIERGELTFAELQKIRFNTVFKALGVEGDGPAFEKYFRSKIYDSAIPIGGAFDCLSFFRGKSIVCAASNGPSNQQIHRLEIAGMLEYFDYVFVSETLGIQKPEAEFFRRAFAIINEGRPEPLAPQKCLMLGDSLTSDIAGGVNAGMKTCLFDRHGKYSATEVARDAGAAVPDFAVTALY